jgi:hypothetical protein
MSATSSKLERRNLRRVVGESGVEMLNEHRAVLGVMQARLDVLEHDATKSNRERARMAATISDLSTDLTRYVELFASMTLWSRLRWLLTGKVGA